MPDTITLSEPAVAILRFRIKGLRMPVRERDLGAYRELASSGIMESVADAEGNAEADYRFTEEGMARRGEILRQEEDRIERERHDPPDGNLSEEARTLLRYRIETKDATVTPENLAAYRELARARIVYPVSGFIGGTESSFRLTYWGYHRRDEWIAPPSGSS